ncbi:hypothetical protein LOC67_19205 [Stieleria sp. JC731]|uniref:hypothetical protein n=1 Tax=Pirellulaceae TaxID=2691357 RepID=UPI001E2F25E8|nr:hypothetical protein [Stieleria sp. JC731]MCC9602684.1 hypothetical protein [Stieleria sp. JC731]
MAHYPAAKLFDSVVGVDVHAVVGVPVHPYFGPIYLWHTPAFPKADVLINGMPACGVGAMGYFFHIPQGAPVPPTPTNMPYWKRYLTNVAMGMTLMTLTIFANIAIAAIAAMIPKPKSVEKFVKDVTGIDTTNTMTTLSTISSTFGAFTQWMTWVKLLMPPIPFPGAQGSTAVGSPTVTVNGGPLAFVCPLMATSCSDIPVVPNAATIGFSNVLVGMSMAQLARQLAVSTAKSAVSASIQGGLKRMQGRSDCGCR